MALLAVDTLVSPATAAGFPRRSKDRTAGAALLTVRPAKERTYPELCRSNRCRLALPSWEGHWSAEAARCVSQGPVTRRHPRVCVLLAVPAPLLRCKLLRSQPDCPSLRPSPPLSLCSPRGVNPFSACDGRRLSPWLWACAQGRAASNVSIKVRRDKSRLFEDAKNVLNFAFSCTPVFATAASPQTWKYLGRTRNFTRHTVRNDGTGFSRSQREVNQSW